MERVSSTLYRWLAWMKELGRNRELDDMWDDGWAMDDAEREEFEILKATRCRPLTSPFEWTLWMLECT